ncbi:MAG TPA: VOC family protein [Dongiaceae bacterium]|nr:VOC family protein [Dongiaceae bacterium]
MKLKLMSVMVDDQDKALKFYTGVLGFEKKMEFPAGKYKWITVSSTQEPKQVQLSLEPNVNPAAKAFQEAMFSQSIPIAAFEVDDVEQEYKRLKALGVTFTREPARSGPVTLAVFSDTCGNLIQIYQPPQ